jgi:integrase
MSKSAYKRHVPVKGHRGIYWSGTDRNKRFEIRYTDGTGKRRFEVVGSSLTEAKARLAEVQVRRSRGDRLTRIGMTFAEVVEEWRATRSNRPRTVESYDRILRLYLLPRFGRTRVADIDSVALRQWLRGHQRESGLAPSTVQLHLAVLSTVLQHAVEGGAIIANPVKALSRGVKPKAQKLAPRVLAPDEEQQLLDAAGRRGWMVPIIRVALLAGLRLGEVCGLQWQDVDFAAAKIHVRHNLSKDGRTLGPPKGGEATIDLHPELRELLRGMRLQAAGAEYVFTNSLGQRRQPRDVQRAWQSMVRRAGLSGEPRSLRFHDLRHSCASRLANAPGASMPWVQGYMRHSSLQTTLGYVHAIPNEERLQAAWSALSAGGAS